MGRPGRAAAAAGPPGGALLLGVLGLFAGAAHGGGLPAGWEAAPGSVAEFPTGPCGVILADPWSYEGRLGMYKTLMGATPALAWDGGRGHPLWGFRCSSPGSTTAAGCWGRGKTRSRNSPGGAA